jgi:hypothetical protein
MTTAVTGHSTSLDRLIAGANDWIRSALSGESWGPPRRAPTGHSHPNRDHPAFAKRRPLLMVDAVEDAGGAGQL